jgi:hypothetical protein
VLPDHLDDLPPDLVVRVQARQRVLEDHADPGPADAAQRRRVRAEEVDAVERGAAGDARAPREPDDRLGRNGLARSRFADDAERASAFHGERHPPDGADDTVRGAERDVEVVDLQKCHQPPFLAGSSHTLAGSNDCSPSR